LIVSFSNSLFCRICQLIVHHIYRRKEYLDMQQTLHSYQGMYITFFCLYCAQKAEIDNLMSTITKLLTSLNDLKTNYSFHRQANHRRFLKLLSLELLINLLVITKTSIMMRGSSILCCMALQKTLKILTDKFA